MKKSPCFIVISLSFVFLMLVLPAAALSREEVRSAHPSTSTPAERKLIILHTSDEHSHLLGVGPESEDYPPATAPDPSAYLKGGIGRRATVFKQLRNEAVSE